MLHKVMSSWLLIAVRWLQLTVMHGLCRVGGMVKGVSCQGGYYLGRIGFAVERHWVVKVITCLLYNALIKWNTLSCC